MAWTQVEIDALKAAIASGVRSVQYRDREVTYHSLEEMMQALAAMEAEVANNAGTAATRFTRASVSRD